MLTLADVCQEGRVKMFVEGRRWSCMCKAVFVMCVSMQSTVQLVDSIVCGADLGGGSLIGTTCVAQADVHHDGCGVDRPSRMQDLHRWLGTS